MENASVTSILLGPLFLMLIAWYIHFSFKRARLYKLASEYNGPPTLPLIGNALKCWIPLTQAVAAIRSIPSYYKSPVRFWFGPYLVVHIWDPEDVQTVLNSPHALGKQPFIYELIETISRRGIATSPVEEWRRHRKLIAPIFNQKYLDTFFDIFQCHSKKLIDVLNDKVGKGIFDVENDLVTYSMDTVLDTLLDLHDKDNSNHGQHMANWMHIMKRAIACRFTKIWYISDFIFNHSPIGRELKSTKIEYDAFMDVIIQKWETDSMKKLNKNNNSVHNTDPLKPKKLIDHFLSASDGSGKFSTEELRGEISTIIATGIETISAVVGYILIILGIHRDIQEKVYKEIKGVLGTKQELDHSDLKGLVYLEQVIKETLRIFSPGEIIVRRCTEEIQLKNRIIPKNADITIGIANLHRDPENWPNPHVFNPDRFLPEEEAKRHPYSWIPFSGGPRNCIGTRYAWISIKTVLSNLILKYKITTDYKSIEDVSLVFIVLVKPTNGYRISISTR